MYLVSHKRKVCLCLININLQTLKNRLYIKQEVPRQRKSPQFLVWGAWNSLSKAAQKQKNNKQTNERSRIRKYVFS